MDVDFWIDPACPFCWVTSRWLVKVRPERDLHITWKPISLFFLNTPEPESDYYKRSHATHSMLRVIEAMRDAGEANKIGDLYTLLGRAIHNNGTIDIDIAQQLVGIGVDPTLADAAHDEKWDIPIRSQMDDAQSLVGTDVGTPIIAVEGNAGRVGLFGPVITKLPSLQDSLELWDGYLKMVNVDGFFELKRTRTDAPIAPDY